MNVFLAILLIITALFLILLILIQRGRGGGLAGAFGGMGGQSAFGTKAGDLFTRVTIGVAAFWIVLCVVSVKVMGSKNDKLTGDHGGAREPGPEFTAPASSGDPGDGGAAVPGGAAAPSGAATGGAAPAGIGGTVAPAEAPSSGEAK